MILVRVNTSWPPLSNCTYRHGNRHYIIYDNTASVMQIKQNELKPSCGGY
jgi:hypothetical protein